MSQTGKRFLSELMNRVKSSTSESRATAKRRERSLSARRLGMEPLEERQLLAVDTTLLAAFSQAEAVEASTTNDADEALDLSSVVKANADALSVDAAPVEETILSQSTRFQTTVEDATFSNATLSTIGTRVIATDIASQLYGIAHYNQGWAATLANILTYTGWSDTGVIVDPESDDSPEQQTLYYIANSFTNDPTSIYYAYAWFMGGPAEYVYQGDLNYAQIYPTSENGGLYPSTTGEWGIPSDYATEVRAADIVSPLYGVTQEYLNQNYGVGVEVHYVDALGNDSTYGGSDATWLTYWGYEYDSTYEPTDVEYYTAVYMSNPDTGQIERMPIQWSNALNSYTFTTYNQGTGTTPYIYSFTAIQRMPGYGSLELDAYEPNNNYDAFAEGTTADLGPIDIVTPSSTSGSVAYGNTFTLDNLTLFAEATDDAEADPVDFYKFQLTQTASNSDYIVVRWAEGTRTQDLKATIYLCIDNEAIALDPTDYGFVDGQYDAVASQEVVHTVGADGKTYSTTYNLLTINLAGLGPLATDDGEFFLKVEFADDVVNGVNADYSVTFNAGYDDVYEENNSFESVNAKDISTPSNPTANLGVLYSTTELTDLVLKQYSNKIDEVDWYRFEMTDVGTADNFIRLYANSTATQINDADLDLYLYKVDPSDPRGYSLVDKSCQVMTNIEEISLEGLAAGVYYIKVTGNYSSGNVEYKLEIAPGADPDATDLRPETINGYNTKWSSPLVVSSDKFTTNEEAYESDAIIGIDSVAYLSYSFTVNGADTATYSGVKLGLFINGRRVSAEDLETLLDENSTIYGQLSGDLTTNSTIPQILRQLFCSDAGLDLPAGTKIAFQNLNLGRIVDEGSFASKYFNNYAQATNSVVVVINPDSYEFDEGFGTVVDNKETQQMSLVYRDGAFYNGANPTSIPKGEVLEVYRNNKYVTDVRYGVDEYAFRNGDVVLVSVVSHKYEVAINGYYSVIEDAEGSREYTLDNNFASSFFVLNNLSEDAFAPNASVSDVLENENDERYCPDLGFANIDNLSQTLDEDGNPVYNSDGEALLSRTIENLVITGDVGSNGAYISDWFRFRLKASDPADPNYSDAFIQINMDDVYETLGDTENLGDLDLYLYKVVQSDPSQSFEKAYEEGTYSLKLIGSSKGVSSTETINFADIDGIEDGNYFICVSGFNGSANRYSLTLGGFTASGEIAPTDPSEYFTEDSVTLLNSVATVKWEIPANDYVSHVAVRYRKVGAEDWVEAGTFKASATSCKITGLAPGETYEFELTVSNHFTSLSATVEKTTDDFLNEVVYRAIIVGVSDYPGSANDLVSAANDAKAFRNALLEDPQWAEGNIYYFADSDATRANIYSAVQTIASLSDDNDVFVFYFAGSGTSAVSTGRQLGYLQTYGSTRKEFISNVDLLNWTNSIAAGSKQFILDAGQVATEGDTTGILYAPFVNSLTSSEVNGASDLTAQVVVLTSGDDSGDNVSPLGTGSRSVFNRALVEAMEKYSVVVTEDEVEENDEYDEASDGRVSFDELYASIGADARVAKNEMAIGLAKNDAKEAILMNGEWSEDEAFKDAWLEKGAIVVTTAVDCVDLHDGKISLREAESWLGTVLDKTTDLENGATFTLAAGSVVVVGTTTGTLVEDATLVYNNGAFRTVGSCSVQTATSQVDFARGGVAVSWDAEDWDAGNVTLLDENDLAVDDVAYNLFANYVVAEDATEIPEPVALADGDVLTTAVKGGKDVLVKQVGQNLRLFLDGVPYTRTTGLFYNGLPVTLTTSVTTSQSLELTKIVFDSSLADQTIKLNAAGGAIVFDQGGTVDASSLKGRLTIDGLGAVSLIQASGTDLVSLVGLKFTNASGAAIVVDSGASLEIANSLIFRTDAGDASVVANDGTLYLTNVTIANNTSSTTLVGGAGTTELVNTIVALNDADVSNLTADSTSYVAATDPGFVAPDADDYSLLKTATDVVDIGRNSAIKTRGGVVLEYDLAGNERVATAGTIDAGAYEYTVADEDRETPSTIVTILEDVVDPTDGETSLREAVAYAGTTYQVETELEEGAVVTTEDGAVYEVKNGKFVSLVGVTGIQTGQYYAIAGVYLVDALGEATALEEGAVVTLYDGAKATVAGTKLLRASGVPVTEGATITTADGVAGTLSYGIVTNFMRNQTVAVALTPAKIDPTTPVAAFDAGTYVLTYQPNGTFNATLKITTTDDQNNSTTTTFEANFKLVEGTTFSFVDATGEVTETGTIAVTKTVELEDGSYALLQDLSVEGSAVAYTAGAIFTLTRGVFTDVDGNVVPVPKGTKFSSPTGMTVEYQYSTFETATLEEGDVLTLDDGSTRIYKDGSTVCEEITLGTTITFKKGLENGVITLERGSISVERAVTLDADLNNGLTIDANSASRAFTIDMYREASTTAAATFNGLTIVNGADENGGLIYVEEGSNFKLSNSTLSNATATNGGAIYNAGKTTLEATTANFMISDVAATADGGAIYNTGTITVTGVEIEGVSAANGAGVYNVGAATLASTTISNATASGDGGAVYNTGTISVSKSSELTDNEATNGGAIYNTGTVSVVNSLLEDNSAKNGGAIYNAAGKASLTGAKVIGNLATQYGGAIFDAAQFFATRTIIAENDATGNGAAIYTSGQTTVVSSLVMLNARNSESASKYSIYVKGGKLELTGDDVVGNKQNGVYLNGGSASIYNSIIGDNKSIDYAATSAASANVLSNMIESTRATLDPSNLPYAPSFAGFDANASWTEQNLRLSAGSAAVQAGDVANNVYTNLNGRKVELTVDFAGNARVNDGMVDIGAYASTTVQEDISTVVTTWDDVVDTTDGLISLREAIRYASLGATVAERTVTFSPDLFALSDSGAVILSPELQTIAIDTTVVVTSAYVDELGNSQYRDITVSGAESNAPLFRIYGAADVEMYGLTFADGHATGENVNGGAFIVNDGALTLVDSVVKDNVADRNGGAIYQDGGALTIIDSLLNGNEANETYGYGGAICMTGGQAYIYNATIADNTAGVYGGLFSIDGLVVLANSIVAQNGGAQNVDLYATNLEATSNLIGSMDPWRSVGGYNGNISGTVTSPVDPGFVNVAEGDFNLLSSSPAVNAGVNAYAFGPDGVRLKYDLNADERIVGEVVDMGAFENQSARDVPSTVVTTLLDAVDQEDGFISLREAITYAKQLGGAVTFDLGEDVEGGEIRLSPELGAIVVDGDLAIDASEVPGGLTINAADAETSVFRVQGGALDLDSVALTGGYATNGGAIYMSDGEIKLTNVLIYGNEAEDVGGGIYAEAGAATLLNTTIAGNTATSAPGAYFGGSVSVWNSILAGNAQENSTSDENYDLYVVDLKKLSSTSSIVGVASAATVDAFNAVNGNVYGTEESPVDAGFAAAASYDFSLAQDSIAVNAGSNRLIGLPGYYASILNTAANAEVVRTDFEGNPRIVGGTVDVGAYEFQTQAEAPSVVVTTLEDVVDPFDGLISLREAVDYAGSSYFVDGVTTKVGRTITFDESLTNGVIELAETLEVKKCVTIDATALLGSLTLDAGGQFGALVLNGVADGVQDEIYVCGLTITGGAADYGAGVYHAGGKATLINCCVYGNEGSYGAGVASGAASSVFDNSASLSLVNCTVANNNATTAYGGVWTYSAPLTLANTIVALNTTNGEVGLDVSVPKFGTFTNSIVGVASNVVARNYDGVDFNTVGTADSPVDPAFNDAENNDFSLVRQEDGFMSIAVNGGDNALIVLPDGSVPATDANANLRIIGSQVDIGAYESTLGPVEMPSLMVTTLEDVVDEYDGLISLREAVQYANSYGLAKTISFAERLSGGTIYLKEALNLSNDITIDGLTNNVVGITLTTADDVEDQSVIFVNAGSTVINGLTITNRYTERTRNGGALKVKEGGAIYVRSGSISLYNSLLVDNAAAKGSAIFINSESESATVNLVNCTVVDNIGQTSSADEGAAIYSDTGNVNLWNSIVARSTLDNGGQAQDVYKGSEKTTTETVVDRASFAYGVNQYDENAPYEFAEGEALGATTSTYLDYAYFTSLNYSDGAFYRNYGTSYATEYVFENGNYARVFTEKTLNYQNDEWYSDGVVYTINLSYGDEATWYDASTGRTRTVYYSSGQFRVVNTYQVASFGEGDTLTINEPRYLIYQEGSFYPVNVVQSLSWRNPYELTQSALSAYMQTAVEQLQADLDERIARGASFTKTENGITTPYPILPGSTVEITSVTATVAQNTDENAAYGFTVSLACYATYNYLTTVGANVVHTFVGLSDTLASQTSGNGSYIGSTSLDLSDEVAKLFVDPDNGDYSLTDLSLATNGGNNYYINQGTINGTFDALDLLGQRRIYYTTIDMGAIENQTARDAAITSVSGTAATLTVTTNRDTVDPTDGATSFREAVAMANKMYALGYTDVTIRFDNAYRVVIDNTLGTLSLDVPMTIQGAAATLDADNSGCALIVSTDGKVVIRNLIIENGMNGDGGGIKFTNGDLILDDCLIYNCQAVSKGGAIYDDSTGSLKLYNTTIAKNVAVEGDGIFGARGSNVELYNSIVATNRSSLIGEVPVDALFAGSFGIYNTLIGNAGTAAYAAQLTARAVNSKIGYGLDNEIDPKFVAATEGNFRLSATDSPAKNAAASVYVYANDSVDLIGGSLNRANLSMGAYQLGTETPSLVVTTLEDVIDATDGVISLREALLYVQSYFGDNILNGNASTGNHTVDGGAGCTHINDSAYNAENAMNNAAVYATTFLSPITFDPSLAGGTIYLERPLVFTNDRYGNAVYDYMIDASSLSGLGGITIDAANVMNQASSLPATTPTYGSLVMGMSDAVNSLGEVTGNTVNGVFSIMGDAVESAPIFFPAHLDIRNVKITNTGTGRMNAFFTNQYGMVTLHNCEVSGFSNALWIGDDDGNDGGLAQVYNSTLIGNAYDGGMTYYYNSILFGNQAIRITQANPAYRQVYSYYSNYNSLSGNTGRFHANEGTMHYYTGASFDPNACFVDYANGDYRLAERSLFINTGSNKYLNTLIPTHADDEVDANGNERVLATTVDLGCYEHTKVVDTPSTVITTDQDVVDATDGVISIREALMYAEQNEWTRFRNTITFDGEVAGSTIDLNGTILLTRHVTFDGGANDVTLNGGQNGSIFEINIAEPFGPNVVEVYLRNMTLTGGFSSQNGGAINVLSGNTYLGSLDIYGNEARRYGGAVYVYDSELTINDCRIGGNTSGYYGGVVNEFGKTVLTGSYLAENVSINGNAGAELWGRGVVNVLNSKNNVIGFVADNVGFQNGVDGNMIGTPENPIKPFYNAAAGNLEVLPEYVVGAGAQIDSFFETFADEETTDDLDVDLDFGLSVFDDDLFEEF